MANKKCGCGCYQFMEDERPLRGATQPQVIGGFKTIHQPSAPGNYVVNGVTKFMSDNPLFLMCVSCRKPVGTKFVRPEIKTSWYAITEKDVAEGRCEECGKNLGSKSTSDVCEECLCPE